MAWAWHALLTPSCPSDLAVPLGSASTSPRAAREGNPRVNSDRTVPSDLAGALTTLFATDRSHTQFEPGSDCLQLMGPASSFGSVLKMLFEVSLAQPLA